MARPGRWVFDDGEFVFSGATTVQSDDILNLASPPAGSTVRRVIGQVDIWLTSPPGSVQNYQMRLAVHQLGALASLSEATANDFPNRWPWRAALGLYQENWDPRNERYWARNGIRFDVDGDRILTASNPTYRFAAEPTGVPRSDGFFVVTWSTRTFVLDPP